MITARDLQECDGRRDFPKVVCHSDDYFARQNTGRYLRERAETVAAQRFSGG
ncbi:MAG: hypothetical protein WD770_05140 [Actinomycetota bacterium]